MRLVAVVNSQDPFHGHAGQKVPRGTICCDGLAWTREVSCLVFPVQ
jgi:hypothetical protein